MSALRKPRAAESEPLASRLRRRIARDGPIGVHDYMEACLADRSAGYYTTRQPIGASGDFITAPEISQIYGELIGAWATSVWQGMGAPSSAVVAELGPGRGTLMRDALRVWRNVPGFLASVSVALVETSPELETAQRETLGVETLRGETLRGETLRDSPAPLQWYAALEDVPGGPLILIANEFIDALPVRQIVREGGMWRERSVLCAANGTLAFGAGAPVEPDTLPPWLRGTDVPEGAIFETRPAASKLIQILAERAEEAPVAALIADYGPAESGIGDTLQAVRRHRFADPLAAPGEADLTAHVDFAALKDSARMAGLAAFGPMAQGAFLLKLGLASRCDRLLRDATPKQRQTILSGAARLVDPRHMGALFKMLALQSGGLAPPPPFGEI